MTRLIALVVTTILTMGVGACAAEEGAVWSTAVATRPSDGHRIIYRYRSEFAKSFKRSAFSDRVIIVWRYNSYSGMPSVTERESMDRLEDLLAPLVEEPQFSSLVIVTTGENVREWTYYTRSQKEFMASVNQALRDEPRFPIEINLLRDPEWKAYDKFRRSIKP